MQGIIGMARHSQGHTSVVEKDYMNGCIGSGNGLLTDKQQTITGTEIIFIGMENLFAPFHEIYEHDEQKWPL